MAHALRSDSRWLGARGQIAPVIAGITVGLLSIAECLTYAILMFSPFGDRGIALGFAAALLGLAGASVAVANKVTLPPNAAGPDSATTALIGLAGIQVAALATANGLPNDAAIAHMLFVLLATSIIVGLVLLLLGTFRVGNAVRFIPYPVVSGFVAGTAVLLLLGGAKLALGRQLTLADLTSLSGLTHWPVLAASVAFAVLLRWGTRLMRGAIALPVLTAGFALALGLALWMFATPQTAAAWYPRFAINPLVWSPLDRSLWQQLNGTIITAMLPELLAIAFVLIINLVGKMTGLETLEGKSGDLNQDMRSIGAANLMLLPLGTTPVNIWGPSSRVPLKEAGGTPDSAYAIAAVSLLPFIFDGSLVRWIPIPIMAGFLLYGAYSVLVGALRRSVRQRRLIDLALTFGVAAVCLKYGYLVGVLVGITGACLLFAFSYSRVSLVRRHASRASFAGNVERNAADRQLLDTHGDAIQIFWLSGYVFFGSIEGLFTSVRAAIGQPSTNRVQQVVLDFAGVTGADASALAGLAKVRALVDRSGAALVFTSLRPDLEARLRSDGVIGGKTPHHAFLALVEGLVFAEEQVLQRLHREQPDGQPAPSFAEWLGSELGSGISMATIHRYFEKRTLDGPCVLYEAGQPAETIDLVESGRLTIALPGSDGTAKPQRTMLHRTVVGEMGFFRSTTRSASIRVEGPTVVHTLTRDAFDRMQRDDPALALALTEFLVRTLADRLMFANRTYAAMV